MMNMQNMMKQAQELQKANGAKPSGISPTQFVGNLLKTWLCNSYR